MSPRERIASPACTWSATARPRAFLDAALRGGVDVIQLRDKSLDDDAPWSRAARGVPRRRRRRRRAVRPQRPARPRRRVRRRRRARRPGRRQRRATRARRSGAERIVGRSTHAPAQGAAADADPDVDYLAVGPVHATPTKPGRPAAGLEYVELGGGERDHALVRDRRAGRRRTSARSSRAGATPHRRRARDRRGRRSRRPRRARCASDWRCPLGQRSRKRRDADGGRDARRDPRRRMAAATRAAASATRPRAPRCSRSRPASGRAP